MAEIEKNTLNRNVHNVKWWQAGCIKAVPTIVYRMWTGEEYVDELLESDVIRKLFSPFASPLLLLKRRRDMRLCVVYIALNVKNNGQIS